MKNATNAVKIPKNAVMFIRTNHIIVYFPLNILVLRKNLKIRYEETRSTDCLS
jgi:hypothetical protein